MRLAPEFLAEGRRLAAECIELLLPQHCAVCGGFGASLHAACVALLPRAEGPRCTRCWRPGAGTWCERCAVAVVDGAGDGTPAFDGLRTPFRFAGAARAVILEAKFRGVTAHLPVLAAEAALTAPAEWQVDAVVGVPLARGRERRRGFNQAAVLARHVGRALGAPVRPDLVRRVRSTPAQASLPAGARWRNLDGAFAVRGVPPERVLCVDDVTTTGATFSALAVALKAAGARRVYGLAVARED